MKTMYTAGYNTAGYLPEAEPARFDSLDEARDFLEDEVSTLFDIRDGSPEAEQAAKDEIWDLDADDSVTIEGVEFWIQTEQVQSAYDTLADSFEERQRVSGAHYICLTDDAPEWVMRAVQDAHAGELPNDWAYRACRSAAWALQESDDPENEIAAEWAESHTDDYYHALAEWLAATPGAWDAVDEAWQEGLVSDGSDLFTLLSAGQALMLANIFAALQNACAEQEEG